MVRDKIDIEKLNVDLQELEADLEVGSGSSLEKIGRQC